MTRRLLILPIFTLVFFGLTSCSSILTGLYGIKKVKVVDEETIVRYSKKYNIPIADSYELDTSYLSFLFSLDTLMNKEQIKNHYQPLQALYFDETGQLQSFQVNCYAGGFPNLKWDKNEIMTTFTPKQQAPVDSILSLEKQLTFLRHMSKSENIETDRYDYIIFVYWNRFMGRQSKRLIRFIQENRKLAEDKKVKIIYANTDNIFATEK